MLRVVNYMCAALCRLQKLHGEVSDLERRVQEANSARDAAATGAAELTHLQTRCAELEEQVGALDAQAAEAAAEAAAQHAGAETERAAAMAAGARAEAAEAAAAELRNALQEAQTRAAECERRDADAFARIRRAEEAAEKVLPAVVHLLKLHVVRVSAPHVAMCSVSTRLIVHISHWQRLCRLSLSVMLHELAPSS